MAVAIFPSVVVAPDPGAPAFSKSRMDFHWIFKIHLEPPYVQINYSTTTPYSTILPHQIQRSGLNGIVKIFIRGHLNKKWVLHPIFIF